MKGWLLSPLGRLPVTLLEPHELTVTPDARELLVANGWTPPDAKPTLAESVTVTRDAVLVDGRPFPWLVSSAGVEAKAEPREPTVVGLQLLVAGEVRFEGFA